MPRSFPRKIRLLAVVGAIFVARFAAARGEDGVVLPETLFPELEGIIDRALSQSPRMISQNLDVLIAQYEYDAARATLGPSAGGFAQYNLQKDDRLRETDSGGIEESDLINNKTYFSFSVSQPLFHWGAIRNRVRIEEIQKDIAASNLEAAFRQLANEVRSAYQQLIVSKVSVRNLAFDVAQEERKLEEVRQRVAEGRDTAGQIRGVELSLQERVLASERAERAYSRAIEDFQRLTGVKDFAAGSVPESIPPIPNLDVGIFAPFREEYVTRNGYEKNGRFITAERNLDVAQLSLAIEETALRPKLNLRLGALQDDQTYSRDITEQYRVTSLYVGVVLNWNIFDSFASRARARSARVRVEKLEQSIARLQDDLKLAAERAAEDLDFAARALQLAETRFSRSASTVARTRELHAEGRVSQVAIDAAIAARQREELNIYVARAGYLNAVTAFLSSVNADPLIEKKLGQGRLPK